MGNRFLELPGYHSLIRGHGIVAAITFLLIVPTAIMINRFYTRRPARAIRYHIWLQVLTLLLATVIFILGYFAVGPQRSLTNPHHGIGVAIYVLVLIQFFGGWWVNSRERRKRALQIPLKVVVSHSPSSYTSQLLRFSKLHKWVGRIIALLGLVQIPLGLTLYGSPLALFILYALVVSALILVYFILNFIHERQRDREYNSEYSYASGSGSVVNDRRHGRLGTLAKGAAAGAGLAALASRFRRRSGNHDDRSNPEVVGSRRHSGSLVEEEKYTEYERGHGGRESGWANRLLGLGAAVGAGALVGKLLGRRGDRDDYSDDGHHRPPGRATDGRATEISEDSLGRVEEGRPLPSRQHPLNQPLDQPLNQPVNQPFNQSPTQPLNHRRSTSSMSYDSYMSGSPSRRDRRGHGLRNAAAGLGAFGLVRNIMNKRKQRNEDRRIEAIRQQEIEDERLNRSHSKRLTGDGFPRRGGRRGSLTASTEYSADHRPRRDAGLPPPGPSGPSGVIPAGVAGAAVGGILTDRERDRNRSHHTILGAHNPVLTGNIPGEQVPIPPNPPFAQSALHQDSSGSEVYASTGGRQHRRHSGRDAAAAGLAGGAAGVLAGEALSSHRNQSRDRRHSASANGGSMASPPVSVKVKMHSDGRHVTLRRLPEQEAAAERAARRQSRSANGRRHRRGTSASSLSGTDVGGGERWRRTEAIERQQQAEMASKGQYQPPPPVLYPPPPQPAFHQSGNNLAIPNPLPPPPPIPSSSPLGPPRTGTGSVGSPGTYDGTGTEASADYANNRRRRRAERAQAKQAREGGERVGQGVEFT